MTYRDNVFVRWSIWHDFPLWSHPLQQVASFLHCTNLCRKRRKISVDLIFNTVERSDWQQIACFLHETRIWKNPDSMMSKIHTYSSAVANYFRPLLDQPQWDIKKELSWTHSQSSKKMPVAINGFYPALQQHLGEYKMGFSLSCSQYSEEWSFRASSFLASENQIETHASILAEVCWLCVCSGAPQASSWAWPPASSSQDADPQNGNVRLS